ncbi:MAG: diadenylate cyclase [Thermodesulfobacteriota bacterium]|nr:diadenylate cyclase [Thermodesulfobacteriota bacterium]
MFLLDLIPVPTLRDFADILFLTFVTYQLYIWFRETRALRVLIGLLVLGAIYSLAKMWGFFLTTRVFQVLWQVLLILLLILFQSEIRQVLEKVSPLRYLRSRKRSLHGAFIKDLVRTLFELADEKTGALIVLVRNDNPDEFIHSGHTIMALPEPSLIKTIFSRYAPAHDGAVILSQDCITQMGCVLPLSEKEGIPEQYGTRHRAALGISEKTDAVCLVVSEERSEVSTVTDGEIRIWEKQELLSEKLKDWLGITESPSVKPKELLKTAFVKNWRAKLGALAMVSMAWLILASQQEVKISITAPVKHVNIPSELVLGEHSAKSVSLALSGSRNSIKSLKDQGVRVYVDLENLSSGTHQIRLSAKNIDLPLGVNVNNVAPKNIRVILNRAGKEIR